MSKEEEKKKKHKKRMKKKHKKMMDAARLINGHGKERHDKRDKNKKTP